MDESERNKPSRTLTPLGELLRTISAADTPFVPGPLKVLLCRLAVFARDIDIRLKRIEDVQQNLERLCPGVPPNLQAQLYGLLSTAEREGQHAPAIPDGARPGGPMAGDIVGGPRQLRAPVNFDPGESYGGTD